MERLAGKSLERLPESEAGTALPAAGLALESVERLREFEAAESLVFVAASEPEQRTELRALSLPAGSEATLSSVPAEFAASPAWNRGSR
jgi:hypothetical protein